MSSLDTSVSALAFVSVQITRHPRAFLGACLIVLLWASTGPLFGFSDTWQLVINTGTTIVTFLLGFLTQHALSLQGEQHREHVVASLDRGHEHRSQLEQKVDTLLKVAYFDSRENSPEERLVLQALGTDTVEI